MAGPVDLLFGKVPLTDSPVDLVFGETPGRPPDFDVEVYGTLPALTGDVRINPLVDLSVDGVLPALTGDVRAGPGVDITLDGTLPALSGDFVLVPPAVLHVDGNMPALTGAFSALYISGASRPTICRSDTSWQVGARFELGAEHGMQAGVPTPSGTDTAWQKAQASENTIEAKHQEGIPLRALASTPFRRAARLTESHIRSPFRDGLRTLRPSRVVPYQNAARAGFTGAKLRHQDGLRDRRNRAAVRWGNAVPHYLLQTASSGPARWLNLGWESDYQEAVRPPPGVSSGTTPPEPLDPCYEPSGELVFAETWTGTTALLFVCERHAGPDPGSSVVVPVKRVYIVLNESSLRRVEGNIPLPTFDMSMSLDVDSWTWSFSASLPGRALADIQPGAPGEPVLVEAMVNGVAYRFQIESRGRDRSFNQDGLRISGRGVAAVLDSPYSPIQNFTNTEERTAQQLMADVLMLNGVSIGWDVDWNAVDWSVPAGLFAQQGSYIDALKVIAAAAGSYIQPHPTAQTLRVLLRYPDMPWDWAGVAADYEIPSDVATTEGIEWKDKAAYNRVFVSGVREGVLGQVTRTGTDGALVAPMVTDSLISTAAAARQRGGVVLADTGAQAAVSIRMPVLSETGIIVPGKYLRYVDGATVHKGLSRSVRVDIGGEAGVDTWQTIGVETHVS